MTQNKRPNYYEVLGISRDSTPDEIKNAFRKLAREFHPDVSNDPIAEEKFKQIGEAYGVLSKPDKRKEYNLHLAQESSSNLEGTQNTKNDIFGGAMDSFFRGSGDLFRGQGTYFPSAGDYFSRDVDWMTGQRIVKPRVKEVYIPENDIALIAALVTAYRSSINGEWRVKPSENDHRSFLKKYLYIVERGNDGVEVFRSIIDWREKSRQGDEIKIKDKEHPWEEDKKEAMLPDTFLGEYYLTEKGRDEFYGVGLSPIHYGYGNYLKAVKSFAKKIAAGNKDYDKELKEITDFSRLSARNTRVEGSLLRQTNEDYEWVKKYDINTFPEELRQAEGRVVRMGDNKGVEGSGKIG